MTANELYDLIIVGGGPGGLTAGIYAMRAALKTVLIEKGVAGGQVNNSDLVENWPGTEGISGAELAAKLANHAQTYGLELISREVIAIEPGIDYHTVRLDNSETLKSYSVILATGGSPRKLGVPGENENYGKGVSYCAVCDGFFFKEKIVAVVGGGDSALEEALYLSKVARKVFLIHRRDEFRAGMILQQRVKAEKKIELIMDTVVTAINADNSGVSSVSLNNKQEGREYEMSTDGVFIFIGFLPNNQLVPAGTRMNADGYVVTNDKCETNNPGIYVVGDLREKYAKQIITAAADGCVAALASAHYVELRRQENDT